MTGVKNGLLTQPVGRKKYLEAAPGVANLPNLLAQPASQADSLLQIPPAAQAC